MLAVQADGHALTTIEGLSPGPGELSVLQDAFCETHGLQCGYCTPGMILAGHALLARTLDADAGRHRRGHLRQPLPLHRLRPDRRGHRARRRPPAQRQPGAAGREHGRGARPSNTSPRKRRVREDRRFVSGQAIVRQRRDAAWHPARRGPDLALRLRPHRQHRCRRGAGHAGRACWWSSGRELAAATDPLLIGVDAPLVKRYPLAVGPGALCRRVGGRRRRRDAGRWPRTRARRSASPTSRCRSCSTREAAYQAGQHAGASRRTAPTCCSTSASSGATSTQAFAAAPHKLAYRVQVGPQRHRADRDLRRGGELGPVARDAGRVGLHPDAQVRRPDRARPAHAAEQRARASGRGRRRQLRRQARHQAHRARGLPLAPARRAP